MNIDSLIYEYEQCKLQAHSAYMHGLNARAAEHYDQAFHLSRRIAEYLRTCATKQNHDSKMAMVRLLDACQNCYEFGPLFGEHKPASYLALAQDELLEIINSNEPRQIRGFALGVYADLAAIGAQCQAIAPCQQAAKLCKQFCALWFIHAPMLIDYH